jgi:4-alpha-glucanotransferase
MRHYHFPGMKVLQFAFGDNNAKNPYLPHNFERNCVAYTGTHDNNTFCGWLYLEASLEQRKQLARYLGKELSAEQTVREIIRIIMMSVADAVIFPLQDILGLGASARMNVPSQPRGNWKWRVTSEELRSMDCSWLRQMAESYGRA